MAINYLQTRCLSYQQWTQYQLHQLRLLGSNEPTLQVTSTILQFELNCSEMPTLMSNTLHSLTMENRINNLVNIVNNLANRADILTCCVDNLTNFCWRLIRFFEEKKRKLLLYD